MKLGWKAILQLIVEFCNKHKDIDNQALGESEIRMKDLDLYMQVVVDSLCKVVVNLEDAQRYDSSCCSFCCVLFLWLFP